MDKQEFAVMLEKVIDEHGLFFVRQTIIDICFHKSEHIFTNNSEDKPLAYAWDRLAEAYLHLQQSLTDIPQCLEQNGHIYI